MDDFITNNYVFTDEQLRGMGYVFWRQFPDGEWAAVVPMTYGKGRICYQLNPAGYEDGWCYETIGQAITGLEAWDPEKDPEPTGWFRHPFTGRRREGGDPAKEYVMK